MELVDEGFHRFLVKALGSQTPLTVKYALQALKKFTALPDALNQAGAKTAVQKLTTGQHEVILELAKSVLALL
jgi:hypothetical protein